MGWLGLIAIVPFVQTHSGWGLAWLAFGGVAYSLGTVFFLWERLPYHHLIWHGFVMGGSACFYFAMPFHVLPGTP